jgi:hypothetical protein
VDAVKDGHRPLPEAARSVLTTASAAPPRSRPGPGSRRGSYLLFLVILKVVHVHVALTFQPVLVCLHCQRQNQPQTSLATGGEDLHHVQAPFDLPVQPLREGATSADSDRRLTRNPEAVSPWSIPRPALRGSRRLIRP